MMDKGKSFTSSAAGIAKVLLTPVHVGAAYDPATSSPTLKQYIGIWDTGASASVITEKIINECGLKPIGMTKAHGADGEYTTEVFLIGLLVPNGLGFHSMRVTKGKLPPGSDMLVGMDVIGLGDFAVTNHAGKTSFSFRCPSMEKIDFVTTHANLHSPPPSKPIIERLYPNADRNGPCPCGSKKKYKKCHGSANPPTSPKPAA